MGANAVVGYQQSFDIEQEYGLVARAVGTAVTLEPLAPPPHSPPASPQSRASNGVCVPLSLAYPALGSLSARLVSFSVEQGYSFLENLAPSAEMAQCWWLRESS